MALRVASGAVLFREHYDLVNDAYQLKKLYLAAQRDE
jgi:hypothetical protein